MAMWDASNQARSAAVALWQDNKIEHAVINDVGHVLTDRFQVAIDQARAAGFAEAIEMAANVVDDSERRAASMKEGADKVTVRRYYATREEEAAELSMAIRSLVAPAKPEEPK